MCSVQDIKEMRGGGSQRDGQQPILPALNWLGSAPSDLVKWSGPKHPVMVLGGLRRWSHSAGPPTNPPSKLNKTLNYWAEQTRGRNRSWREWKEGEEMQPNPIPATDLKSTQSTDCGSGQRGALLAVKTMERVCTHGLSQRMHAYTHTHAQGSHSFSAFHTYGKQEVHYPDTGNSTWHPSLCLQMYLSCRYNIWAAIISKAKNL